MAEKKKLPTASGTGNRPSRLNKISSKMQRASSLGDVKKAVYSVRVLQQNAPVEIAGNIVSIANGAVTIQYFRSGSSKELLAIIPTASVIAIVGGEGKPSIVTYLGEQTVLTVKQAYVQSSSKDGVTQQFLVKDLSTGDNIMINVGPSQRIEIIGDASSVAESGEKKKKKFKN